MNKNRRKADIFYLEMCCLHNHIFAFPLLGTVAKGLIVCTFENNIIVGIFIFKHVFRFLIVTCWFVAIM